MANQRIDQLNAETTPAAADVLPVYSIAGSDTKKITVKNLVQQGAALVDNASIPNAKINLSGISGTNLSAGTVAVSKLDTSTIPATGGVTVSSSNLQLVAPTSPIVRNAGTGSLEHANSGVTAGTYTKVTVDVRGHVTVGAAVAAADLPIAISGTVGVMSPGTGLAVTGGGVLNHSSSVTAGTTSGFTYNAQGHITGAVALAGADLPISTSSVIGAVRPGTGLSVDGNGILAVTAATNAALGGVIAGSDFSVTTGTISLAAQAGIAAGQYTKVTINSKGIATAGTVLSAGDIPNIATSQITSGTLAIDRYGANTITGAKLANYATGKISEAFPTADYISQLYFNPLDRTLYMWDGNVYQPIGVSYGQVVFSGTYDAGTNLITSVTTEGAAIGLTVGGALTAPVTANKSHYVVVDQPGTGTAPAPAVALSPPDMLLSNGTTWILLDVSDTVTAQLASNVQVSPAGNIASTNVQSALQELDDEKLPLAGGTLTGNLALNTGIDIVYEGATTDNFETTLYVVDPTADRTILLPNVSGTVVTTGDTGTVTSTMLLDGTILNEDINASAAIVDTKLATIATALKVSNSATTAASANTASAIVARDASGNFTAGTITAALTGAASSNVLKAGDTMTGALVVPLASASTPSLTFTGDLNTGIYSPGADQVAVATNGTGKLFVDANGSIGVGTSSPTSYGSGITTGSLNGSAGSITDFYFNGVRQGLVGTFASNEMLIDTAGAAIPLKLLTNSAERARIRADGTFEIKGAGTAGTSPGFSVNPSTPANSFVIDSSGRLGIGTSAPAQKLEIQDGSISIGSSSNVNATNVLVAGYGYILSSTKYGNTSIRSTYSNSNNSASLEFYVASGGTSTAEAMRIDSAGRVGIGVTSPSVPLHVLTSTTNTPGLFEHSGSVDSYLYLKNSTGGAYVASRTNDLSFHTAAAATERARIDSSGRLLVGTSTDQGNSILQVQGEAGAATAAGVLYLRRGLNTAAIGANVGADLGKIQWGANDGTIGAWIQCLSDATWSSTSDTPSALVFSTTADGGSSPTERMRIHNDGRISTGTTSAPGAASFGFSINRAGSQGLLECYRNVGNNAQTAIIGGSAGEAYIEGDGDLKNTNNSYGAISDQKLKENIVDASSQWVDIKTLQVRRYNFKEETGYNTHTQIGLVAQEVELVSPGLVNESPDRDEDGNDLGTVTKSVNYSVLYMKAVKALQEAMERIEALEADVAQLKGA